jgi:hypothetical protein
MTEAEWLASEDPARMLSHVRQMSSVRQLRLFAVGCCRRVEEKITLPRSAEAISDAELYADGRLGRHELSRVREAVLAEQKASENVAGWSIVSVALGAINGYDPECWDTYANAQQASLLISDDYPAEWAAQASLLRCIFGNPFCPVSFSPAWRTDTAVSLARQMYEGRDFSAMPILADALQDAGCDNEDILNHCRGGGPHVRGCWVVDLVLGKA